MGRVIADDTAVRGGAPAAGVRAYGVCLQDAGAGDGSAGCGLSVDASWLDATGTDGGVGCTSGSLASARFVTPAGGAGPATGQPGAGPATDPALKPASTTPRITTTTKATVTKATASKPSKAKAASAAATLPKTTDVNWIAVSLALFLLGAALLGSARRSTCAYTLPG